MKRTIQVSLYALLILTGLFIHGCAVNPVTGKKQFSIVSESQEIQMGQGYHPSVMAQFGEYKNPQLEQLIETKGKEMAAKSHRPNLPWNFELVDSEVVNAFAVPGGFVYFTRGIMAHFNNEAQFMGVLGHEIGHVTAKHSVQQQSKQTLLSGLAIGGMILSPELASMGESVMQGMQLLFLKFGRDDESQSDQLGVEYSTLIGYDAKEMAGFFSTLDRLSGGSENRVPTFMSTHPDPLDREAKVRQMATAAQNELKAKGVTKFEVNRDGYLRMLEGMVYGPDPRQGFVENDNFYHPDLKFTYRLPVQWQTQNTPQVVQTVQPDGKAAIQLRLAQGNDPAAAAQQFASENKLQVISSGNQNVNGNPAVIMVAQTTPDPQAQQQGQQQQIVKVKAGFISYGGNIYLLMGLTSQADFVRYEGTFNNTIGSFRQLTDAAKLNRQPERLRIATSRGGTLQSALSSEGIPQNRLNEFSVLNGMQLNESLPAGTLFKVLQR
ncbi:MAG: M48 family metalloprotease [Bacteroidota bacterium]